MVVSGAAEAVAGMATRAVAVARTAATERHLVVADTRRLLIVGTEPGDPSPEPKGGQPAVR
jgi:hypothetical protein